ncbi:SIR2 family NAD-dependent protein deacylase [Flavobacterium frigoris]|uniref:SIR2-like domain-containing protein n=1 Tax=Flavobacterium frigoris TaxID=229204 RepID=A0A1H9MX07_FLAFI|nr:SIR2 family protein [Flavobacterium frigoris]SER28246.1 SIR2-like domain-containing protein [Flavobacterium frigoris]
MEKERLFELIRKEEVLLFAGAGMSMYAGYPSGKDLAKIMHNKLTTSQQDEVQLNSDLLQITEDIYNLKNGNKNFIIEILKKEFQKDPISTETHNLLAKIPQIKTVITTNYDDLFERTNRNLEVIRRSSDYSIVDSKKQLLFKIHGDLSDTKNIILTKSDYNNFFIENKAETVFWTAVKDRLVSNHILFIGYSLEDSNMMVLFERILRELGDHGKELYFVAPSINLVKKKFLEKSKINYIESTGEDLIKEIYEDLKLNYIPGLSRGNGTADTAFDFGKLNQIDFQISKRKNTLQIGKFFSLQGLGKTEIKFNLELPDDKREGILKALRGKSFDDVILDSETIREFSHFFNDIRISNGDNVKKFLIKKIPDIHGNFEFVFEDGFELDNYKMEIFIINPEENKSQMKIMFVDFTVIIEMIFNDDNTQYKIEILPNKLISSVKSGLHFYNIFSRITNNQKFRLFKDDKLFYTYDNKIKFEEDSFDAKFLLDYFQKLKKIEQHFAVKFSNIVWEELNKKTVERIITYIEKKFQNVDFLGLNLNDYDEKQINNMLKATTNEWVSFYSNQEVSIYNLHSLDFKIGYKHHILQDAYIANKQDVIDQKTTVIELKSKSNSMQIQYSDQKTIISN